MYFDFKLQGKSGFAQKLPNLCIFALNGLKNTTGHISLLKFLIDKSPKMDCESNGPKTFRAKRTQILPTNDPV